MGHWKIEEANCGGHLGVCVCLGVREAGVGLGGEGEGPVGGYFTFNPGYARFLTLSQATLIIFHLPIAFHCTMSKHISIFACFSTPNLAAN